MHISALTKLLAICIVHVCCVSRACKGGVFHYVIFSPAYMFNAFDKVDGKEAMKLPPPQLSPSLPPPNKPQSWDALFPYTHYVYFINYSSPPLC